jgi:hypothetical protein
MEVKRTPYCFRGKRRLAEDLPCFGILGIFVVAVVILFVIRVAELVLEVFIVVEIVFEVIHGAGGGFLRTFVPSLIGAHVVGSAAAFGFG